METLLLKIWERLGMIFDPVVLGEQLADRLVGIVAGLVILAIFYLLWRFTRRIGLPIMRRRYDETAVTFLETVIKFGLIGLGIVYGLDAAGIETSAVLASLGIAGLTIGFAARDALSNLISGILIFLDRPFVIGDLVEVEGHYGRVDRITLRSTRIVTVDGRMLAVPNTEIINKTVASYTNFPHLRLDIGVTVGVGENLGRVRATLLDLVRGDRDFLAEPAPRVIVKALNDYNVAVELQAWLNDEREHIPQRFELRERVFEALRGAGVHMPYETLALAPLEVSVAGEASAAA